jgi:hypothetical protein
VQAEGDGERLSAPPSGDLIAVLARVLESRAFAKTARLASFLRYICTARAEGRVADLTEQRIGQEVFGRTGHYNPTEDTIVRSTARLLRQRLESYYEDEGRDDRWRLAVPRGAYAPVVVAADCFEGSSDEVPGVAPDGDAPAPIQTVRGAPAETLTASPSAQQAAPRRGAQLGGALWSSLRRALHARSRSFLTPFRALSLGMAVVSGLGAFALTTPASTSLRVDALWTELFDGKRDTLLVMADSNLVMYQLEVLHEVPLEDYIAKRIAPDLGRADVKFLKNRQTAVATVGFAVELSKLASARRARLQTRYARDLHLNELKQSNAILLGVRQSNPWVELFRERFNFHIDWDIPTEKFLVRNDRPLAGERAVYEFSKDDPSRRGYVHIAFTGGVGAAGHMLLVSGTTAPGTEAAQEFVLDAQRMKPVLERAVRSDGSIGDFELLLRCVLQAGGSTDLQLVAMRAAHT